VTTPETREIAGEGVSMEGVVIANERTMEAVLGVAAVLSGSVKG